MTPTNFADRLFRAMEEQHSCVCVGLDPRLDLLPATLLRAHEQAPQRAVAEFCAGILAATRPHAAVTKLQSAYFEALGPAGWECLWQVVERAQQEGYLVIVDAKRADIGTSAEAYACAFFGGALRADAVTVNPYLGTDGILPFVDAAGPLGGGVFVLVKTSNPSSDELQDLRLDGGLHCVYQHVGEAVRLLGAAFRGECGYSAVGAVVGATYPEQLRHLRRDLSGVPFLVPGYGAQGATAADVAGAFDDEGRGALVNASRSVCFAFRRGDWQPEQYAAAAAEAACQMQAEINSVLHDR